MNLFVRLQQKYQHFVLSKVPKPLHHLRFLVILLVILSVPVTLLLTQTSQDLRQRASYTDNNNIGIIINPSPFPSISQAIPSPYPTSTPSYSPSPSFPVTPTPITNAPFITQITYPMCEKASCDLSQATCSWLPVRDTATYMIRITDTYSGQLIAASKTEATTLIYNFPVITGNTYSCTLVAYNKDGKALDTSTTNLQIQINPITPFPIGPYTPSPKPSSYPTLQPTIGPANVTLKTQNGYFYADYIYVSLDGQQIKIPEVKLSATKASNSMVGIQGTWSSGNEDFILSLYYDLINPSSWALDKVNIQKITIGGTVTNYDVDPVNTATTSLIKGLTNQESQAKYAEWHELAGSSKVTINLGNVRTQPFFLSISPTPTPPFTPFPSKPYPSSFPATPSAYPTYAVSGTPTPFPTKPGAKFACDFNKDGTLDISDYTIWLNQFINGGKPLSPLSADCNGNGQVDIYDYNLLLRELRGIYQ